jgi:signal transduction histidine kinase
MSRLARIPIRVRVTVAFAAVMALLLAALGLFLYLRLGDDLNDEIERGLRSRAADVTAVVWQADDALAQSGSSTLIEEGENLTQVVDSSGRIVDSTPSARSPVLSRSDLDRALEGTIFLDSRHGDDPVRLLATPVDAQGKRLVVITGAPKDEREEALNSLLGLLLIGGPVALLLASLAGYGAAAAALRPVERMRARAETITDAAPGQRLPVPPADDEIGRLGSTLNDMLGRLEEAFARERTFVADASHELRTPLAILKGELELALRAGRTHAELEAALRSAAEETDRLVQLAEDLLVIARSDQGRLPIRLEEVAATDVFEDVCARFARRAADGGAELHSSTPSELRLCADRVRMEQAVGNLVDNAIRYGGKWIELAAVPSGSTVALHVRDDGPGFSDGMQARAFERFTRGDAARGRGGAGLGMAIVSAIAGAHGGSAGLQNRPGGGADVWVVIPACES